MVCLEKYTLLTHMGKAQYLFSGFSILPSHKWLLWLDHPACWLIFDWQSECLTEHSERDLSRNIRHRNQLLLGTRRTLLCFVPMLNPAFRTRRVSSEAELGPVFHRLAWPLACADGCLWCRGFRGALPWWGRRWCCWPRLCLLLASLGDGESVLNLLVEGKAWQEVRGHVLCFDPRAGAHLGFAALVECHVPWAPRATPSVDHWRVRIVAVLLETLPELAVICECLLGNEGEGVVWGWGLGRVRKKVM